MKRLLNFFDKNLLLKIASLNSVSVVIRMLMGFITSKFLAFYVGPAGLASVGNLRDFFNGLRSFSTLGFYNGLVKYIAENKNHKSLQKNIISTSFISVVIVSVCLGVALFCLSEQLSRYLFSESTEYSFVFKAMGIALPFLCINTLVMAGLNGYSKFKKLLKIQIAGQILAASLTIFLIWQYLLNGALIAIVVSELSLLIVLLFYYEPITKILEEISIKSFKKTDLKKLSGYSFMAIISAISLPLVFILIRNFIIANLGAEQAGYWEGMNRLSRYYLMFVSTLLTLYLLPKLSAIHTARAFRKEIFSFYRSILPWFGLGLILVYFLRRILIKFIFTEEFLPMENLFLFQLLGDFVKVMALVISYQFLAKKMIKLYVITEIISVVAFYFLSIYLVKLFGIEGVVIAHFCNYCLYFALLLYVFRKPLLFKIEEI